MKEWFFYWKKLVFIFITKNKWEKIENKYYQYIREIKKMET